MATAAANKRLTREYKTISENPPPYITAHPSENNILEWHYLLTGPPDTPYTDGQYWGTLHFPPEYPFKPPAIRMITPSGRFQPATRLCLSISDFHPKSFNPAWEVSTILIGLLSFMTSEEMTTGSVRASDAERRIFAQRSSWWNSTGGGSIRPEDLPSDPNANPNNLPVTKATRGGPGSINDIRAAGLHPITVPRDPDRGEHVDGHQGRFLSRMAQDGLVDLITMQQPFLDRVGWRLDRPAFAQVDRNVEEARVLGTVDRFAHLVDGLFDVPSEAHGTRERRRPGIHQA